MEKRLDRFLEQTAPPEPMKFVIRSRTAPRNLRNCADLVFHDVGRSMHVVAHYLAEDRAIFTVTAFEPGMVGQDIEIVFSVADRYFRAPLRVESGKFSFVVRAYCALFRPLDDRANLPVMQTNSQAAVSRSKFYSVCAILNYTPAHAHLFFDEEARAALIARHFSAIVVTAYQSLAPATYRADLFRYLFAYLNACIYFDVKMVLNVPISAIYHLAENDHIFAADVTPRYVYTAFFVSFRRRSAIFKSAILMCLDRIAANDYCADALSITGPGVLGAAVYSDARFTPMLFNGFEGEAWQQSSIKIAQEPPSSTVPTLATTMRTITSSPRTTASCRKNASCSVLLPPLSSPTTRRSLPASIIFCGSILPGPRNEARGWMRRSAIAPRFRASASTPSRESFRSRLRQVPTSTRSPPRPRSPGAYPISKRCPRPQRWRESIFSFSRAAPILGYFPFLGWRDAIAAILERAPRDWQAISIGWG